MKLLPYFIFGLLFGSSVTYGLWQWLVVPQKVVEEKNPTARTFRWEIPNKSVWSDPRVGEIRAITNEIYAMLDQKGPPSWVFFGLRTQFDREQAEMDWYKSTNNRKEEFDRLFQQRDCLMDELLREYTDPMDTAGLGELYWRQAY